MFSKDREGVSSVNNDGSTPIYRIDIYSGYTDFKCPISSNVSPGGGARGKITEFSPRSRKNLLKALFSLSSFPNLFITLTYPRLYPRDAKEWKRHLDNFSHSLKLDYPKAWFIWKLEPQRRGAPHYHLIGDLGTDENIFVLRRYLSKLWYGVCGTDDPSHLKAGVQADYVKDSKRKIQAYVCKYVGKAETGCHYEEWARPGRFWGKIGRKNLPPVSVIELNVHRHEFIKIKRLVRRWLKSISPKTRKYSQRLKSFFSFFLLTPRDLIQRLVEFVLGSALPSPQFIKVIGDIEACEIV